ncbi:MAG: hypothetical protein ACI84K_000013 [Pseudohongiellaceae bacterium]|jgi:hypothetical protein
MSLSHRFYNEQKILLTSWSGEVTDTALMRFYMSIYNNSQWHPEINEIIDLRDAQLEALSSNALLHLSELATSCLKGASIKLAIISPSELSSHVARVYEAFSHIPNESIKVVHHLDEALDWLK